MSHLIAIVGRPNVGKSALFNRLVGRRIAIVHDQPGVTRDRVSAEAEWRGHPFTLVDTGGIGLLRGERAEDAIIKATVEQVNLAIDAAAVILFVVDVAEGIMPLDREVADQLRRSGKPVVVVANKVDTDRVGAGGSEFAELGFERLYAVSAIHGEGIEALMKEVLGQMSDAGYQMSDAGYQMPDAGYQMPDAGYQMPDAGYQMPDAGYQMPDAGLRQAGEPASGIRDLASSPLRIAIVGRPNVGKSSIINSLTRSERVIVSPIPGTTRDAVDVPFEVETEGERQSYVLIDTAGMRKARRVNDSIEFFSVKRAEDSIARCDLAVLVLDAEAGITEQDKKVADKIVEERKACIVVVNKWDLVEEAVRKAREEEIERRRRKANPRGPKPMTTLAEFGQWVQEHLFFLDYAPVIFTSASSGFNLERLLEAVRYVAAQLQQKIPTAILNRTLQDAVERRQPVSDRGHRLKFFYATQVRQAPPTFLLFVNRDELFSEQYKKYLADQLRRAFGYEGCPLVLVPKPRPQTIEPVRRRNFRAGDRPRGKGMRQTQRSKRR